MWLYVVGAMVGVWCLMGWLGGWVARQKRRPPHEGAWLGLLFGPLGVIVEALLPSAEVKRPIRRRDGYDFREDDPDEDRAMRYLQD